jgi:arylsulfate sulfotransferase
VNYKALHGRFLGKFANRFLNTAGLGALFAVILAYSGCGYVQSAQNPAAKQITISITPVSTSVRVNGTVKFEAIVSNTSNTAVTWWVNGALRGDTIHGTIDSTGMYTAPAASPVPAAISIRVISSAAPTVTATAIVTVQPQVIIVAILPQSATLSSGQVKQFTATVTGDSTGAVWSVNGIAGGNSAVGFVDSSGNYTAPVVTANITVTVTATSKKDPGKSASASVTVVAAPIVVMVSPQSPVVIAGQVTQFKATVTGAPADVTWAVNGNIGGNSAIGTIDTAGNYTAPDARTNLVATVSAASKSDPVEIASASVTVIASGVVAPTANVQVAMYTITPSAGASVSIEFGPDTTYGFSTSQQSAVSDSAPTSILVAGMRLNTTYHMRAVIHLADGSKILDADHSFTTGTLPDASLPNLAATTTPGATPQSGVELVVLGATSGLVVADLSGNVLWNYNPSPGGSTTNQLSFLPNGHFLVSFFGAGSNTEVPLLREIDLTGQTIWELTTTQLNQALAVATCVGCNITAIGVHHDFALLPNGHVILIAAESRLESGLTGFPDPTPVVGDVLIDLDENHKPVWLWSSFDHLDLNRHLLGLPDWTHANSIVYSPDDKSLIMSMRHQSWVFKIDYQDSKGTGNILWRLGYQGDFIIKNGVEPQDWFSLQHDANIASPNSSGIFQLLLFDDGGRRVLDSSDTTCGVTPCESRVPLFQLDETAKTATIQWVDKLAPAFSFFGGSARVLKNGNIEFDDCGLTVPGTGVPANSSTIMEVTKTTPPQTVWQMQVTGQYAYRSYRIPSLYPGVQW